MFILNEKLQFISVTCLWSHGVDKWGQYGLEPTVPTSTPMFSPWVGNRWSRMRQRGQLISFSGGVTSLLGRGKNIDLAAVWPSLIIYPLATGAEVRDSFPQV